MKKIVTLAAAAAAAFAGFPANAQSVQLSEDGQYRISIPYTDLNLASPAGVRTLEGRIKAAANVVCGTPRPTSLIEARGIPACRHDVMRVARPQMELALNTRGNGSIASAASR